MIAIAKGKKRSSAKSENSKTDMNWSGGGKKRFRPRIGPHLTKPLFRHQNRITLVDDRYIEEMISKGKHDKTAPLHAEVDSTPTLVNSNNNNKLYECSDEDSPGSMFGDIPLGTPSQPRNETCSPIEESFINNCECLSQKSDGSNTSCTILETEGCHNSSSKFHESSASSPKNLDIAQNESGLFEGDDLSNYNSPPKSNDSYLMQVNRYLMESVSQRTPWSYPNVASFSARTWNTTGISESTPVRKQVRFGVVNVEGTPLHLEANPGEPHKIYPKTPILKKTTTETPQIGDFSSQNSALQNPEQSYSEDSIKEFNLNNGRDSPELFPCQADVPASIEPMLQLPTCGNQNADSLNNIPLNKKRQGGIVKTKKKLISKKVIVREKVTYKVYKTVKAHDVATQTP